MDSSLESTVAFVEAVKHHPVLYNGKVHYYNDPKPHNDAWQEVASSIGQGATAEGCKRRWKELRLELYKFMKGQIMIPIGIEAHLGFFRPFLKAKMAEDADDTPLEHSLGYSVKLVNLVRARPCLYSNTNRKEVAAAWQEISRELKDLYPECSPTSQECQKQWRTFRTRYINFLQRKYPVQPLGLGPHLDFLIPFLQSYAPGEAEEIKYVKKLAKAVQEFPSLYVGSARDPSQSNAWKEVAKRIGGGATAIECWNRWSKLRDGFELHLRDGSGPNSNAINFHLRFLKPFITTNGALVEKCRNMKQLLIDTEDRDVLFLMKFLEDMAKMSELQKRRFRLGAVKLARNILDGCE